MAKIYRYRLESPPEARNDGTGLINFDLFVEESRDDGATWDVPQFGNNHKTVVVPREEIDTVLAGPGKGAAMKNLLKLHRNTIPAPPSLPAAGDWDELSLEAASDAYDLYKAERDAENSAALATAQALTDWISSVKPEYPIPFDPLA